MKLNINNNEHMQLLKRMKEKYNADLMEYRKAYDYYCGDTDTQRNYPTTKRSNRKVQDDFIKCFIDEEVAFMVGMPITYSSKSSNVAAIDSIGKVINSFDTCCDIDLATDFLTYGTAYEYSYLNHGKLKTKVFNPLDSIGYIDNNAEMQLFLYFYTKPFDENRDKVYINVIDDFYIYHFDENFTEIEKPTEHYFKKVPVSYCKMKNGLRDTLYYNLKSLQDVYEATMSDYGNEISDSRLAYLLITGMDLDEEIAEKLREKGVIQCPDSNGKAEFITKNISSDFIKAYREIIKEDIYRVAHHVDNQAQIQSNTSGSMLAVRINCLRIKITKQNKALEYAVKSRLELISRYLDVTSNGAYDVSDITIKTQLNLPSNDVETAQIVSQMADKLSIKTGLERLSFVTNGEEEFNRMLEEKKILNKVDIDSTGNLPVGEDDV